MKRAQSMAHAAWTRPSLRLSSWSCIGPRRRAASSSHSISKGDSQTNGLSSENLISAPYRTPTVSETVEFPVHSSSMGMGWSSETECSHSHELGPHADVDADIVDGEDLVSHTPNGDRMTEVELWQQLEQELYNPEEGEEPAVAKELREEEAEAIAEVGESGSTSSIIDMKEAHRFFPPGKIMHIVTLFNEEPEHEGDDSASSSDTDEGQLADPKVGIFLTPRSLYSRLRLSQTMISDHFMPVYRRQIEKVITELENEAPDDHHKRKVDEAEVLL